MTIKKLLSVLLITIIVFILNYPLTYAVVVSGQHLNTRYAFILAIVSVIYALTIYLRMSIEKERVHVIYPIAYGTFLGYILCFISALLSAHDSIFTFMSDHYGYQLYNIGVVLPMFIIVFFHRKPEQRKVFPIRQALIGLFYWAVIYLYFYEDFHAVKTSRNLFTGLLALLLGVAISSILLRFVYLSVRKNIRVFRRVTHYLGVMTKPVTAFFLGYIVIILFFTGLYSLMDAIETNAFKHLVEKDFWQYLFFSYNTITAWGGSGIIPTSELSMALSILENFIGLIWITVIFAATLAYLQRPFIDISKKIDVLLDEID